MIDSASLIACDAMRDQHGRSTVHHVAQVSGSRARSSHRPMTASHRGRGAAAPRPGARASATALALPTRQRDAALSTIVRVLRASLRGRASSRRRSLPPSRALIVRSAAAPCRPRARARGRAPQGSRLPPPYPIAMLSAIVVENRNASCGAYPICPRSEASGSVWSRPRHEHGTRRDVDQAGTIASTSVLLPAPVRPDDRR